MKHVLVNGPARGLFKSLPTDDDRGTQKIMRVYGLVIRCRPSIGLVPPNRISLGGAFLRAFLIVFSLFLTPGLANAYGNLIDSFTYSGNQDGFPPGAVYTLSTAGPELNVCFLTPSGDSPNLTYTPSCQSTLAPNLTKTNNSLYSAVAYLGSVNNPNNYFAVGDNDGNVYLMQLVFNYDSNSSQYNPNPIRVDITNTYKFQDVDDQTKTCGQITSLIVDPNEQYIYISCVSIASPNLNWQANRYTSGIASGAVLFVASINSDGTLGNITATPSITPSNSGGYWAINTATSYTTNPSKVTAAVWGGASIGTSSLNPWVNAKLRAYPVGFPGLAGTKYSASGGVFYSGIISGLSNGAGINSGLMCSNGSCEVAYNILLTGSKSQSVMTAAEYGVDANNNVTLYWNQVESYLSSGTASLGFDLKTSNTVASCRLSTPLSSSITSTPCYTYNEMSWPPQGLSSAPVWVDQLIFSPTPEIQGLETSYTNGLLQMSTWNDGYIFYYDVVSESYTPAPFLSGNGDNGKIGANVYGMTTDANGNLLIQAGESGLIGFNAFPTSSTNIATQTDVTYVPIPADSNTNNTCGEFCEVKQAYEIISEVVSVISADLDDSDEPPKNSNFAFNDSRDANIIGRSEAHRDLRSFGESSRGSFTNVDMSTGTKSTDSGREMSSLILIQEGSVSEPSLFQLAGFSVGYKAKRKKGCCEANLNAPAPTLSRLFGSDAFWAEFTYSEKALNLMGLNRGDLIGGLQLRVAAGVGASPRETIKLNNLQIKLDSGPNKASVFNGSLCLVKETYRRDRDDGYGPAIKFYRHYRYLGGDLTLEVLHSGSGSPKRFYLDGLRDGEVSGAYAKLESVQNTPNNVIQVDVAPMVKFRAAGHLENQRALQCR